ncbi:hypothetical protein GAH_00500 [Geoglobus ahangari]|uniref:Uncharacterized protein n=1 Tax=Geoglobus ahangari TaxID=113653 RepID=A0A0F7IG29_9EURY|nr:hypothetical protein [Geoglobus ahangari]AKG92153.1 hypothetical protein GAH_00500 [Geoglobus ahangari]
MRSKVLVTLFGITLTLVVFLPSEHRLGDVYKLIYFHVPISIVTISTILLFPLFHARFASRVMALSVTTTVYALVHLILSAVFMYAAWSGVIFSEPKFVFSSVLLIFALSHTLLCFVDRKLAKYYSFLSLIVVPYFYMQATLASFQLHPRGVEMPAILYLPYLFSAPMIVLLYVEISERLKAR